MYFMPEGYKLPDGVHMLDNYGPVFIDSADEDEDDMDVEEPEEEQERDNNNRQ